MCVPQLLFEPMRSLSALPGQARGDRAWYLFLACRILLTLDHIWPSPRSRKPSSHQGSGSNPATQQLPPSRDPALLGRFPMMQYRGEDGSRTRGLSPVIGPTTPDEGWQGEAELIAGRASQLSRRDARKELRPASRWVEGRHPRQEFVISGRGETMWQGPGLSWRHSARTEPAATASVQSQVRSDADRGPLSRTFTQASRTAQ